MMKFVNKQFSVLMLLLVVSITSAKAQSVIYASRLLEQMAKMMQMTDTIKKLPEGVSLRCYSYKGLPLTVVKNGNRVRHIGYSIFTKAQREKVGEIRSNFIERFLLTTDLPLKREKTVEEEMQEEKILFRSGSLSMLKSFVKDNSCTLEASLVKERMHTVKWSKGGKVVCEMGFPADHELMTGRNMLENDERLQMDILSMQDSVMKGKYSFSEKTLQKHQDIYVLFGGNYMFKELSANRFFLKNADGTYSPLCNTKAPRESIANLFTSNDIKNNYTLAITQKQFNYNQSTFTVPLAKWVNYYKEQGFSPYFCIISQDKTKIDCLLILHNQDMGCNHVMRIKFNPDTLVDRSGSITARLNAFVPTSNIKDLYYENQLK